MGIKQNTFYLVDLQLNSQVNNFKKLECGPMPNVMVALPNIGGVLCSTLQSMADAQYQMPCSNAAKMRNPLKFAGVPQTTRSISVASGLKFTILWGDMEDILLLNKFFFRLSIRALIAKTQTDKVVRWCPDGDFGRLFLHPVFSASRVQQVSDLHLKFALRPHHVWKYGRHPICSG